MAEALVSIAVKVAGQQLTEVAGQQLSLFAGATREVEKLSSTFESIKAILDDAESRQAGEKPVQLWLSRLRHAAYDVEDLLEDASNHAVSHYNVPCRIKDRYSVAHRIKEIRERLDQIDVERNRFDFSSSPMGGDHRMLVRSQRQTTSLMDEAEMVVGRENDKQTMISRLVSGSSCNEDQGHVQVVSIVGIGGLGKTTLAQLIYHDAKVRDHFNQALYWVCVSDVFDVVRLTKAIIEQVKGKNEFPSELDALQKEILEALRGKRFLLVLDDVWNEDKKEWKKLPLPLNIGARGSRILITTRSKKVAETMDATQVYYVKGLSNDYSWELFKVSAFAGKKPEEYLKFKNFGREIANNCNGVPLSIKAIGSAMRSKKTVEDWKNVLDSKIWSLRQARDEILPALLLTYCHLPAYLKQCFAYCSVFPKDWEFKKDVLVKLWVVQGFIQPDGNRKEEDIGDEYFDELVARSMFQKVKEGPANICKMHDLLHDLAKLIAKDEIYTFISKSKGGKSEECPGHGNVRHAFLSLAGSDDKPSNILVVAHREKKLWTLWFGRTTWPDRTVDGGINSKIDDLIHQARFLRALHFPYSTRFLKSIGKLKHLTYLCLPHSRIVKLPDAIGKMQQLRYLDLSWSAIVELPESVGDLRCLHTLNLWFCRNLKKLPRGIGRMVSLRHLQIEDTYELQYLPKELGRLSCLQSLSKFIVRGGNERRGCGIGELQQLNSLQGSLRIQHFERVSSREEAEKAQLWKKEHLRHLVLSMSAGRHDDVETERIDGVLEGLRPQENIEKLELYGCTGSKLPSWMDGMRHFSKLVLDSGPRLERVPHLPSLKEFQICGVRNEELPEKGWEHLEALQKLIILQCMELKCLPEGLTQLPSLEQLDISSCNKLKSLPEGLGQLKKLKSLHVYNLVTRCLPDSFGQLESLERLHIGVCLELESLPGLLGQLKKLKSLRVARLEVLRCLPDSLGQLESLESLHISLCKKLESLPISLGQLKKLKALYVGGWDLPVPRHDGGFAVSRCLPDWLGQPKSLESPYVDAYDKLESLPDSLGQLRKLKSLRIVGLEVLRCLPDSLGQLESLESLDIENCWKLESLSASLGQLKKLESLHVRGLEALRCLPDSLGELESLESLRIESCWKLDSLPDSLGKLKKLKVLHIGHRSDKLGWKVNGSGLLRCLPGSLGQLESLEHLCIDHSETLDSLPNSLGQLNKLKELHLSSLEVLKCVPDSIGQLESLESLNISSCKKLESLPLSLGQLNKLKLLRVGGSEFLRCLPDSLGQLESLESLDIGLCLKLESLPDSLGQLKALKILRIGHSDALASLPQGLRCLSILHELEVYSCLLLRVRFKRVGGVDISHIPNVWVNGKWIQRKNPR